MLQQNMELTHQLKLTPKLMQSLNILALNQSELAEFIETLYTENPCIEISYPAPEEPTSFESNKYYSRQGEESFIHTVADPSDENSLPDYLYSQINFGRLSQEETSLIRFIAENLDEWGFYPFTAEQTIQIFKKGTVEQAKACLALLQSLEPCGICSKDLKHCLKRQLDAFGETNPAFQIIIDQCLELFAAGKFRSMKQRFGISQTDIDSFRRLIPRLNPKPGASFGIKPNGFAIPDILILEGENGLTAALNESYLPKITASDYCKLPNADEEAKAYLKHKMDSAEWAIRCLEKRNQTLLALANELISENQSFFETGKGTVSRLSMQDTAARIGVHLSTVSRSVRGKYLQCRFGTYPLKYFFLRPVLNEDLFFNPETDSTILSLLHRMIAEENKAHPYSDKKIADRLAEMGYPIARRTVVKYRGILNIPSSIERKQQH